MIKDKVISKMVEMEIKDFSDTELRRVFKDCVAQNNLFASAKRQISSGNLTMKDVYFLPCPGNDESMLDEILTGHQYHCPNCNTHLTSLYFCGDCGVRWDWVVAFDEAVEQGVHPTGGTCPGHAAPVVNGYCFDCGLPRPTSG